MIDTAKQHDQNKNSIRTKYLLHKQSGKEIRMLISILVNQNQ